MTAFALYAILSLHVCFIAQRAWSLFAEDQEPTWRIADGLIIAFYAAIIVGVWPLTIGAAP